MKNKRFRIPIIGLICCMLLGTIALRCSVISSTKR